VVGGVLAPCFDEVLRLGDVDDADDAAEVGEHHRASGECVPSDRVEDDVDPLASRRLGHGVDVIG
jgi:hypothetical protein